MPSPSFTPDLFRFLTQLKRNNRREWFQTHRDRYLRDVRDPMLRFIEDVGPRLHRISPHIVADPNPVGGSMFRVHRDVRFSKDKKPYKTAATARFNVDGDRSVHVPGFYLHLEPGSVFIAAGVWRPDSASLAAIRDRIVDDPPAWTRVIRSRGFRSKFELTGDSLKRAPRGFDPDHPLVDDLKRKDFIAVTRLDEQIACGSDFINRFARTCRGASSLVGFLAAAVDVEW